VVAAAVSVPAWLLFAAALSPRRDANAAPTAASVPRAVVRRRSFRPAHVVYNTRKIKVASSWWPWNLYSHVCRVDIDTIVQRWWGSDLYGGHDGGGGGGGREKVVCCELFPLVLACSL